LFLTKIKSYSAPARLGLFVLTLLVIWLPFATPIYLLISDKDPNLTTILTMGLLFIALIILLIFWGKYVYNKQNLFKVYGLIGNGKNLRYLSKGLIIGWAFTAILFITESWFGWLKFNPPIYSPIQLIFEGLMSALAIAFGEELIFRGWLLEELDKDYDPQIIPLINALAFAILHFIKPISEIIRTIVNFPAYVLLGLTLVWAKRSHQNLLGICIGLHAGLVWGYYIFNVGEMLQYTNKVPPWITGIDRNPIAGIMGLLFLTILSILMKKNY
jgi:membrane protease YdiL (CAAX protease family)